MKKNLTWMQAALLFGLTAVPQKTVMAKGGKQRIALALEIKQNLKQNQF